MDYLKLQTFDPESMAQLQADQQTYLRRQQLAQALMGSGYVPDSGKMGVVTSALSSLAGAFMEKKNNASLKDLMARQFEQDNAKAIAARKQQQADEEQAFQRKLQEIGYGEKAKRDFATKEFKDGGVFDPTTGQYAPSSEWMQQQLGLKRAEAGIAAANRAPPADPFAKIKAAVAAGVITPEQAQQAMQRDLLGGGNAPSGYRAKDDGSLEAIPGGPADKQNQPRQIPADMAGKVALADEYIQNYPGISKQIEAGALTGPWDSQTAMLGYGKGGEVYRQIQAGRDALQRTLTGAGMPASEASEYGARYMPTAGDTVQTLKSKQTQLFGELKRYTDLARGTQGDNPASQTPSDTKTINGKTFVKVGDQWFAQ